MTVSAALILSWLTLHGYPDAQAKAILKYLTVESGLRLCIQGQGGSYLAQWTGTRKRALATKDASRCPKVQVQLGFMDHEIKTTFRARLEDRGFWKRNERDAYSVFRRTFGQGF